MKASYAALVLGGFLLACGHGGPGGREGVRGVTATAAAESCIAQLDYDTDVYRAEAWCYRGSLGLPSCTCYTTAGNAPGRYLPFVSWRAAHHKRVFGHPEQLTESEPRNGDFCWGYCATPEEAFK